MNYIIHLNKAFAIFCEDERLTPFHVSLYFSLFQYWNMAKFRNPISISRDELMRAAKIGSVNTYIRTMKELHAWNYVKYIPSYNPQKGSQVYLYTFDNSTNKTNTNSNDNGSDISHHKGTDKAGKKAHEKPVIPSINSTNKTNKLKHKKHEHTRSKNSKRSVSLHRSKITKGTKEKSSGQKEKKRKTPSERGAGRESGLTRPLLSEIRIYFVEKRWPLIEAEKFFNYYSSNGWLVGGKTPMKNWKSSCKNWMLNTERFTNVKNKQPGRLNVSTDKNYSEPL